MGSRRTKAQIEQMERQILRIFEEQRPLSVRNVFYQMTNPRLPEPVEKTENGYRQVQHRLTRMRRENKLPWGWIVDSTRRGYHVQTFGSASEALQRWHRAYRADLWSQAPVFAEVWCESRSISGVLQDTCEDLAVSLYPAGGFASLSMIYEAAQHLNGILANRPRPLHIFYVGDHDPAGVLIDESIEAELRKHLDPEIEMHVHRLAVTQEQIESMDLPTKPRKAKDRRALHVKEAVEAEAIPANTLRDILRSAIEEKLPAGLLQTVREAEESERRNILFASSYLEDLAA